MHFEVKTPPIRPTVQTVSELLPGDTHYRFERPVVAGSRAYVVAKRLFDLVISLAALIVLFIPLVVIALLIKAESPGSAFYSQERVGLDGSVFRIYKLRTMFEGAESGGPCWAAENDVRVTPLGRKLRDCHLDEIPQFFNVLRGDMSLVGPRPERPAFCDAFEQRISGWEYRTLVKPGITGLAQVSGGYSLLPNEKIVFDLDYIGSRSVALDLRILFMTVFSVARRDNVR